MTSLTDSQRYELCQHATIVRGCAWDLRQAKTVEHASLASADLAKVGAELEAFMESCKAKA